MKENFILGVALCISQNSVAAIKKDFKLSVLTKSVVIAIVDTGADINHSELKDNLWKNLGETGIDANGKEKESNLIDDDDNGFVDDVHGWNFVTNSNNVSDTNGHGTHVAGIIKKVFNQKSARNTTSTLPGSARFMILKYYDSTTPQDEIVLLSTKAIRYATMMNAQIINYSGGGPGSSYAELAAIKETEKRNIIFVAAAGNNQTNNDLERYYPASYQLSNMISVAAIDADGSLAGFSNFGSRSVDIAAPGKDIKSALPKNKYGIMSGTSQATAFVTGVVAKLLSTSRGIHAPTTLIKRTLAQAKPRQGLTGKTKYQVALLSE